MLSRFHERVQIQQAATAFQSTDGVLTGLTARDGRFGYVTPTYRFKVDGKEYTGTHFRYVTNGDAYTDIAKALRPKLGSTVRVYYDSHDPTVSVLDQGPPLPGYFWKQAAPNLVVAAVCVFVLLGGISNAILKLSGSAGRIRREASK